MPIARSERDFATRCIASNVRHDGRASLASYRPLRIHFGALGDVLVHLGDTQVHCVVECAVVSPKASRPQEGFVLVRLELSPVVMHVVSAYAPPNTTHTEFVIQASHSPPLSLPNCPPPPLFLLSPNLTPPLPKCAPPYPLLLRLACAKVLHIPF